MRARAAAAAILLLVAGCGDTADRKRPGAEAAEWSYSGETGPARWGSLKEEYAACSEGRTQSPVDITDAVRRDPRPVEFSYEPSEQSIVNNGHSIQIDFEDGGSIRIDGRRYDLVQLHFHHPSEHTTNGRSHVMEMHIVHEAANGDHAVVGVFIDGGTASAALTPAWEELPTEVDEGRALTDPLDVDDLLPTKRTAYRYDGSLTTPPCTEGVRWAMLSSPIELSSAQIEEFAEIYRNDARPTQPLNGRKIVLR